MTGWGRPLVPLALAGVIGACDPTVQLPRQRAHVPGCAVYSDVPVELSTELAVECGAFRSRLSDALEMDAPVGRVEYALFASRSSVDATCDDGVVPDPRACAWTAVVVSDRPLHLHELVHAHLLAGGAIGTTALQEGAAVVFGCETPGSAELVPNELAPELLVSRDAFYSMASESYPAAASLVSFLLDEHGAEAVRALLERGGGVGDLATLDAVARDVLGRSISEALAVWRARPPEPWHRVCRPAYQCGAPPLDGSPTVTLVRGVAEEVSRGGVVRTFTVERAAELHVIARAVAPRIEVLSCDRGPGVLSEGSDTRELDVAAPVGPGRYALWMTGALLHAGDALVEGELVVELR